MSDNELYHVGKGHLDGGHSGRYPYGSGENPYQHEIDFLARIEKAKREGKTEKEIAEELGYTSTTSFRKAITIAGDAVKANKIARVRELHAAGKGSTEISRITGYKESTIRGYLKEDSDARIKHMEKTVELLKKQVDEKGIIDVGSGVETNFEMKRTRFDAALEMLRIEGYTLENIKVDQLGTGQKTTIKVLAAPGVDKKTLYSMRGNLAPVTEGVGSDGTSKLGLKRPASVSSDRIQIVYAEEGGIQKDGVIELRRGVEDISLGNSHYAQVRIAVDDTHYLKGMALYSDDLPPGVDIRFNTNKPVGTPPEKVFKPLKTVDGEKGSPVDWDNPFGAAIKLSPTEIKEINGKTYELMNGGQREYIDKNGEIKLSAVNKVNEEGDWGNWSKSLASQMLSKQEIPLIRQQLSLSLVDKQTELQSIQAITNPTIRQRMLEDFAKDCDASAEHLKAAALPRQASRVILPVNSINEKEIYAPGYKDGEHVVLIRYPHGGTFEIPELVVNNHEPKAVSLLGNAGDAVGINCKTAEKLSGADFDGDTVIVIPVNNRVKVKSSPTLKDLEGFDPKIEYKTDGDKETITPREKQKQMGIVSNLITDMTIGGASEDELARAVKHSMVVIDSEKHKLDYKKSFRDNNIAELQALYQRHVDLITGEVKVGGASTLLSRAKNTVRVPEISTYTKIDPKTGELIKKETGRDYTLMKKTKEPLLDENGNQRYNRKGEPLFVKEEQLDADGNVKKKQYTTEVTQMSLVKDARLLSTGTMQEEAYAQYANSLKAMANAARKEAVNTKAIPYSPTAKKVYEKEVASLTAQLNDAKKNKPLERKAQVLANEIVKAKLQDNPNIDDEHLKKIKGQALNTARIRVGAHKQAINVSDKEWEAIQAGAITKTMLLEIMDNANMDTIRAKATPNNGKKLSDAEISKVKAMYATGSWTLTELAEAFNVASTTISKEIKSM